MFDPDRPFTRQQALAAGVADHDLRSARFRRLIPGTYVAASVQPTLAVRAEAALLRCGPDARASHRTAAQLLAVPLPSRSDLLEVTIRPDYPLRSVAGVVLHRGSGDQPRLVQGVRISSALDLFSELAGVLGFADLVAVGDHAVRKVWLTPEELCARLAAASGRHVVAARRAAGFVRFGAESPMETKTRLLLVLAGLPEPLINPEVTEESGRIRRYDLLYETSRTIIEYDGRQHAEDPAQWRSDLARREAIDDGRWRILVLTARDIYVTPGLTLERIHRVLLERGEPGVPRTLHVGWRAHFGPDAR